MTRTLLLKFSRGECTEEEVREVRQWLSDGNWPDLLDEMDVSDEIRWQIWDKIHYKIHSVESFHRHRLRKVKRNIAKIAAVALILIGTAAFIYYMNQSGQSEITYASDAQQYQKIILSDSSVVFLSPSSTLTVIQPYGDKQRKIKLRGEAVFEVAQKANSPFIVVTGDIATTALGTSFKVSSFEDKDINIALSYGKVVVEDRNTGGKDKRIFMNPGETVVYHSITHTLEKTNPPTNEFSYKNNILFFKNAGVKEVVNKLERYYQMKVDYEALKQVDWHVSGEFNYQPLEVVMQAISYSCNIHYSISDDTLYMEPKNRKEK